MDWEVTNIYFNYKNERQPDFVIANVGIIMNNSFLFNDIGFAKNRNGDGYTLMFPRVRGKTYYFPIKKEVRELITEAVVDRYEQLKAEGKWRDNARE